MAWAPSLTPIDSIICHLLKKTDRLNLIYTGVYPWYQVVVKPASYISVCILALIFASCSKTGESSSDQTTDPVNKPLSTPSEKGKEPTNKEPKSNETGPTEKDPPCCKGSAEIHFEELDVHGKLSGFDQDLHSMKEYQGKFVIDGDAEAMDTHQLQVIASMPGMSHDIEFPNEKISEREYKINPVVFSMAGEWNVSWSVLDANGEKVDSCVCKAQVK